MFTITIDIDKCKACKECVDLCAINGFEIAQVDGREVAVYAAAPDDCIGCMSCESACEEGAITVQES